jgi:hypothetical protein
MAEKKIKAKFVKLNEKTRVLLNKAKSMVLFHYPKTIRVTDDMVLRLALLKYLGVK